MNRTTVAASLLAGVFSFCLPRLCAQTQFLPPLHADHPALPIQQPAYEPAALGFPLLRPSDTPQKLGVPSVDIPRISSVIVIDGVVDSVEWSAAARIDTFHETYPVENGVPPVVMHARLARDAEQLYVAFRMEDDPAEIRASWRQRDQIWSDDYVGIILDTWGEGNWAYMLFANAFGVQGDTRYSTFAGEDDGLDVIYATRGRITAGGYEVEFAIPFRSLRFPAGGARDWRMNIWVTHPRASRATYAWAPVDRGDPCMLCQLGHLKGMAGIEPGSAVELLPAVTASQTSWRRDAADPASVRDHGHIRGEASLGLRYDPVSSTALELAINPDFSQVESDAAQIDVNSTFALFYPEHRPFFQEGADLYASDIDAVYTRSINAPLVAAKAVGSWSRTSVIAIGAWDERSPILIPLEESSVVIPDAGASWSTILRARHAFGNASWIGAIFTDRRFRAQQPASGTPEAGSGTIAAIDGALRFGEHLSVAFVAMGSQTGEGRDDGRARVLEGMRFARGAHTAALDGERYTGYAATASTAYAERFMWSEFKATVLSPTFRAANGFITQNDRQELSFEHRFMFYPGGLVDQVNPAVYLARVWNMAGVRKDEWIAPSVSLSLKGQTNISASYLWSDELFGGVKHDGIRRWSLSAGSSFSDPLQLSAVIEHGRFVARTLEVPVLGTGTNAEIAATIKPFARLVLEPSFLFSELIHPDGRMLFNGHITRLRTWYQFTRELSLRLVLQYDHFDRRFAIEPLVTWQLNPWSMFYVGMTHQFDHLIDPRSPLASRVWDAGTEQYFLKLQYLLQY